MKSRTALLALVALAVSLQLSSTVSAQAPVCDTDCLVTLARDYMAEVARDNPTLDAARQYNFDTVRRDFSALPWTSRVRYTENNVAMMIGEGFWGAARGDQQELLVLADEATGNVLWYGITEEHEQAAYHGIRLKVENGRIADVESYLGREGTPDLFASPDGYRLDAAFSQTVPGRQRSPRERMIAIVDGYYNTKQLNDGALFTQFADACVRVTNGVDVTYGDYWAADIAKGCQAQMEAGIYRPVDRIRARRFPIVDEAKGIVVALAIEDHAARYVSYQSTGGEELKVDIEYPNSRGMLEIFKIIDGRIARIEGVSVFLPYYIHSLWTE